MAYRYDFPGLETAGLTSSRYRLALPWRFDRLPGFPFARCRWLEVGARPLVVHRVRSHGTEISKHLRIVEFTEWRPVPRGWYETSWVSEAP